MLHMPVSFSKVALPEIPVFNNVPGAVLLPIKFVESGREIVKKDCKTKSYAHGRVIRLLDNNDSLTCAQYILQRMKPGEFSLSSQMVGGIKHLNCYEQAYTFQDVPIEKTIPFFSYLASQRTLFVPFYSLHDFFDSLVLSQEITLETKEQLAQTVPTILTEDLFLERVDEMCDEQMALALACRYAEEKKWMFAVKWLAKAKQLLLDKDKTIRHKNFDVLLLCSFSDREKQYTILDDACKNRTLLHTYVDLTAFWERISKISGQGIHMFFPGMEELVDSAANAATIKEVSIQNSSPVIRRSLEGLGRFLKKSSVVERVSISDLSFGSFNEDISPIISGLSENSSLRELIIRDYAIGDEGVFKIVNAILSNSNSKINYLELALVDMTCEGVQSLIGLLRARLSMRIQLVEPRGISVEKQANILQEAGDRITITYRQVE